MRPGDPSDIWTGSFRAPRIQSWLVEHVPFEGENDGRAVRWLYAALAYVCVALALAGLMLPGLPTTPFVLLAAWSASRGSRKVHGWLHRHPHFGPALADWRERRAVSGGAKASAVVLLTVSWLVLAWRGAPGWLLAGLFALFLGVAAYVVTRPRPLARRPCTS